MKIKNIFKRNSAKKDIFINSCELPYEEIMKKCKNSASMGINAKRRFISEDGKCQLIFSGIIYESSYEFFETDCDVWVEELSGRKYLHKINSTFVDIYKTEVTKEGTQDIIKNWLTNINCRFREIK